MDDLSVLSGRLDIMIAKQLFTAIDWDNSEITSLLMGCASQFSQLRLTCLESVKDGAQKLVLTAENRREYTEEQLQGLINNLLLKRYEEMLKSLIEEVGFYISLASMLHVRVVAIKKGMDPFPDLEEEHAPISLH